MDKELVSIIVPVYNAENYLEECIESIVNQTYQNIEIILVDDKSLDSSYSICKKFACTYSKIRCYKNKDKGVSGARNKGLIEAKGEYIIFVDSDDIIAPDYVGSLACEMKNTDMVLSGVALYDEYHCIIEDYVVDNKLYDKNSFVENIIEKIPFVLISAICCKCYKRKIIKERNIEFISNINIGEDCLFNLEYLKYASNVSTLEYRGYFYRKINEKSLTNCINYNIFIVQILIYNQFIDLFEICKSSKRTIDRFINIWLLQIRGNVRKLCTAEVGLKTYIKVIKPLESGIFSRINYRSVRGIRQKLFLMLIRTKIHVILFFYFELFTKLDRNEKD